MRNRISPVTGERTLLITQICQADFKGKITPKLISFTLPATYIKWYNSLRKVLLQYKEAGDF